MTRNRHRRRPKNKGRIDKERELFILCFGYLFVHPSDTMVRRCWVALKKSVPPAHRMVLIEAMRTAAVAKAEQGGACPRSPESEVA